MPGLVVQDEHDCALHTPKWALHWREPQVRGCGRQLHATSNASALRWMMLATTHIRRSPLHTAAAAADIRPRRSLGRLGIFGWRL
jgi:hypothetical protein